MTANTVAAFCLGAAVATLALPVTAAGNAGGRILSGWLSDALGRRLPYDSLGQLRRRLFEVSPRFQRLDAIEPAAWGEFGAAGAIDAAPFALPITNFYMTDPISRASETMAQCSELYVRGAQPKTGTHG